jgi:hypothetical protein
MGEKLSGLKTSNLFLGRKEVRTNSLCCKRAVTDIGDSIRLMCGAVVRSRGLGACVINPFWNSLKTRISTFALT